MSDAETLRALARNIRRADLDTLRFLLGVRDSDGEVRTISRAVAAAVDRAADAITKQETP